MTKKIYFLVVVLFIRMVGLAQIEPGIVETNRQEATMYSANMGMSSYVSEVRRSYLSSTVRKWHEVVVELNETLWIDVVGLDDWLKSIQKEGQWSSQQANVRMVVPYLNGVALPGVYPDNPAAPVDTKYYVYSNQAITKVHHLRFTLSRRGEESKKAWQSLLNRPVHKVRMSVSVGLEGGAEMPTSVTNDKVDPQGIPVTPFYLVIIPVWKGIIGLAVVGSCLLMFIYLAAKTDIVRDTTGPLRPDGRSSYSLARVQMAFWFFLVISSFFFLWIIIGDTDTLTTSVLGLIGISAGTALGSAVIDAGKTSKEDRYKYVPVVPFHKLKEERVLLKEYLDKLVDERKKIATADHYAVDSNRQQQIDARRQLDLVQWQITFDGMFPWKKAMYDILGDGDVISFHRFQIFVWTIVIGIIFVAKVYNELVMPEFSGTLLGLLGISAGTYIGFKIPEPRAKD